MIGALVILFSLVTPAGAQATGCETSRKPQVPEAQRQDAECLSDLTTRTLGPDHTRADDWAGLHAAETVNPAGEELIPGL